MQFLRRNSLPMLIGAGVTLFVVALVVGVADLVRDDEPQHAHRITVGAAQFDLDALHETLEGLDLENLDLAALLDSPPIAVLVEALRDAAGGSDLVERLRGIGDRQPALGVTIDEGSDRLVVAEVAPGSAAAGAGIERGDEILSVGGRDVGSVEELRDAVQRVITGDGFAVELRRDGRSITVDVEPRATDARGGGALLRELGERVRQHFQQQRTPERERRTPEQTPRQREQQPARSAAPQIGVTAVDAPDGVRVTLVQPLSGAAQAGLRAGDLIVAVEGVPASSVAELRRQLSRFAAGDFVRVTVLRAGGRLQLSVLLSPPAAVDRIAPQAPPGGLLDPQAVASAATEAILDRLADLVAERLAARAGSAAAAPEATATATAEAAASAPATPELTAFFGRVAAIDDGSVRLDGTTGSVAFVLTEETQRLGFKQAAIGDLVTVVIGDGVVQLLIVVG
ncbi:MAG: PDZ domain-containing protein [Dehalococcoidia bacterium]